MTDDIFNGIVLIALIGMGLWIKRRLDDLRSVIRA